MEATRPLRENRGANNKVARMENCTPNIGTVPHRNLCQGSHLSAMMKKEREINSKKQKKKVTCVFRGREALHRGFDHTLLLEKERCERRSAGSVTVGCVCG